MRDKHKYRIMVVCPTCSINRRTQNTNRSSTVIKTFCIRLASLERGTDHRALGVVRFIVIFTGDMTTDGGGRLYTCTCSSSSPDVASSFKQSNIGWSVIIAPHARNATRSDVPYNISNSND